MIDRDAFILVLTKPLRADDDDVDDEDDPDDDDEGNGDDEDEDEDDDGDEPETWQVSARGPYCAKGYLLLDFG